MYAYSCICKTYLHTTCVHSYIMHERDTPCMHVIKHVHKQLMRTHAMCITVHTHTHNNAHTCTQMCVYIHVTTYAYTQHTHTLRQAGILCSNTLASKCAPFQIALHARNTCTHTATQISRDGSTYAYRYK